MKDGITLFIALIVVFGVIFFGLRTFVKKTYKPQERSAEETQQRFEKKVSQQDSLDNTQDRYRDAMRQQRQRIKDLQRK